MADETHWHLEDSGQALIECYAVYTDAIKGRRKVYEDMKAFVDTRNLMPITRELTVWRCEEFQCVGRRMCGGGL